MEPKNVQALVGLGMLDMNSNNPQAINNGLQVNIIYFFYSQD